MCMDNGNLNEALTDFNEAIRLKPEFAAAYNNRGLVHIEEGNLGAALYDFNEAIRIQPGFSNPYFNRAMVWERKGDYIAIINDYHKYLGLGGGICNENQERIEKKILYFREILKHRFSQNRRVVIL